MKLVRTLSMIIALAGASTALADTPPTKAPAPAPTEKKADKPADKAPAPAPAKPEFAKEEVDKIEKFFGELYDAVTKNQDACPKMATALNTLIDKNQDWVKKLLETGKDLPKASKDKMQKKQAELGQGMAKCKDDKSVEAAIQRFVALGAPKKKADPAAPPPATPATKK